MAAIPGLKIARRNRSYIHSPHVSAKRQESGQSIEGLNSAFVLESGRFDDVQLGVINRCR